MPNDDPLTGAVREEEEAFADFFREIEPRLRRSLIAALGGETGREAAAEALAWAWEHWARVQGMENPGGYLFRLGRNRGLSMLRRRPAFSLPRDLSGDSPWFEPGLPPALARLPERQRVAVLLIHGFSWTYREVAAHLGVEISTVQSHVERGMARLRHQLKVGTDA